MLLLMGCSSPPAALRTDVEAYLSRAAAWSPVEAETARTLERILATEFVDEAEVMHQIDDARPRIEAHLARVREYRPATRPVRDVHRDYVRAWEHLLGGFEAIERGFRTADWSNLADGRQAMALWRDGMLTVATELRQLTDRTGAEVPARLPS